MAQAMQSNNGAPAKKQPVDIMSFYIPHVDADIQLSTVASVIQNQMEIGEVNRIEAVPKVNQTDGHKYNTCFVYLHKWGSSYNAQFLRNQIVEGKETKLFYMKHHYWKVSANTSGVAKLALPNNYSLELYIPSNYTESITLDQMKQLFDTLELGCVSGIRNKPISVQYADLDSDRTWSHCIVVDFQYWYHTVNADQFQKDIDGKSQVILEPVISGADPDMQWLVRKGYNPVAHMAVNPYIYFNA